MQITINSVLELQEVAIQLLKYSNLNKFIIFNGEMGAGKTTFIKEFCKVLGVDDVVSSPTFSIVNVYDIRGGEVFHFDFYRLKNVQEAYDIGYEDYFYSDNYCLVEWPQKVEELLPENYVSVEIEILEDEKRRFIFKKVE